MLTWGTVHQTPCQRPCSLGPAAESLVQKWHRLPAPGSRQGPRPAETHSPLELRPSESAGQDTREAAPRPSRGRRRRLDRGRGIPHTGRLAAKTPCAPTPWRGAHSARLDAS